MLKELPFLLTLLFTLAGGAFMKLSNTVTSSPTIEYKLVKKTHADTTLAYYRLVNLSNNKQFSNLIFLVQFDPNDYEKSHFIDGRLEAIPPAAQFQLKPNISLFTSTYTIPNFNPKEEYHLCFTIKGQVKIPFLSLSENEGSVVVLRKASLFTFFIQNEEYVYATAFLVIMCLIFIYVLNLKSDTPKTKSHVSRAA
ncbi:MAG: hypothetical protein JWR61_5198 [Ferruginibacter sp.]|uniref:hypothetical protein n=1 Tax=Ferruginibacter sp. TaxID=1940288 RepID=UPI0026587E4C|nr:hypothetical protein [Ferruginibacter sp.]MDB5280243.1 hypothetical protein [Ferruginibacter sp.]